MDTQLHFEIPDRLIKMVEDELNGIKRPEAALKQAINQTAEKFQRALVKRVKEVYRYKGSQKSMLEGSTRSTATSDKPYVDIHFSGRTIGIEKFTVSARKKGLYGAVLKSESKKLLKKPSSLAFKVRFENGHEGVVYRADKAGSDPDNAKLARYGKGKKAEEFKYNKHTARLKSFDAPAVPSMIKNKEVYGKVEFEYQGVLEENLKKEIEKAVLKYGP